MKSKNNLMENKIKYDGTREFVLNIKYVIKYDNKTKFITRF